MEQIIAQLMSSFDLPLMVSITILTYLIIKIIDISPLINTTKTTKHIITGVVSIILCVVYYYFINLTLKQIIPTYLLSIAFYNVIISRITNYFNVGYTK